MLPNGIPIKHAKGKLDCYFLIEIGGYTDYGMT